MSNTGPDSHTVETQDITVTKEFTPDDLPVPAVRFHIDSNRSDRATVRITEDIPAAFSMDSIGFHPRYDAENWAAYEDNRIVYERLLAPGEQVETVYGLRIEDPGEATAFMSEPAVSISPEDGPPEDDLDEIAPPEESQAVRDLIADPQRDPTDLGLGDKPTDPVETTDTAADVDPSPPPADDEEPATEADFTTTPEEPADPPTRTDEASEQSSTPASSPQADRDGAADQAADGDAVADVQPRSPEEVLQTLTTAIEEAEEDELAPLVAALGTASQPSVDARLDHLQARVEEVAAYESALESFLNSRGDDGRFLPDLQDRVSTLETEVEELEAVTERVSAVDDDVAALSASVEDLETTVADLETDLDAEVGDVEDRLESLETTLDAVDDELTTVSEDLEELKNWRERLGEMFS